MNKLTQYLVNGILNEGEEEVVALYGGGFKPPTGGHFEVVKTALQQNPEITNLKILVGSKERDGVDQAEAILVWEIYAKHLPMKVEILPSKKPPIGEIKSYAKSNPGQSIYWVIGARKDNEDDFKDIEGRSKGMEKYPNMVLKPIVTNNKGMSGTNARLALKTRNVEEFKKYLPSELSKNDIEEVFQILSPSVEESKKPKTNKLSPDEKDIVDDILSEVNNLQEANLDKLKEKITSYGKKGLLTLSILLSVANGLQANPDTTSTIIDSGIEMVDSTEQKALYSAVVGYAQKLLNISLKKGDIDLSGYLKEVKTHYESLRDNKSGKKLSKGAESVAKMILKKLSKSQNINDYINFGQNIKTLNESLDLKDRIDYYLNYFTNVSPSTFDLSIENDNILIGGFDNPYPPNFDDTKDIRQVPVGDEKQPINEGILDKASLVLPRGKKIYLQAESEDYDRGLIVELTEEGGYKINYWYGEDAKVYPVEVVVDGESIKPDAEEVWMKFHPELKKESLNEGRYDTISNRISSDIFNNWKSNISNGLIKFNNTYIFEDDEIEIEATLKQSPNFNDYKTDGGAYSEEDSISVEFEIDPGFLPKHWNKISMDLKDIIRHEIEHLTHGEGFQEKPGKYMAKDSTLRNMIDAELLPKSDYFKLEKEIDANLQGMYFRAKKEKKPIRDVINNYLDLQNLTSEEKREIISIWSKRTKALSLPSIKENLNEITLPKATEYISKLNPNVDAENIAKDFIRLSPNLDKKDLFQYKEYDELEKELNKASKTKSQRRKQAKSMDLEDNKFIFYKDNNFTIYKLDDPSQHPESCEIAQGAKICVASNSKKYWNQYMIEGDGVLFYIRNKTYDIPHPESVIAFMFPRKGLKIGYTEMVDYNDEDFIKHGNYEDQKKYLSKIGIPSNIIEKMFKFIPESKPLQFYIENYKGKKKSFKFQGQKYYIFSPDTPPSLNNPEVIENENGDTIGVIKNEIVSILTSLKQKWLKIKFPKIPPSILYIIDKDNKYFQENAKEITLFSIENNKLIETGKAHLPYDNDSIRIFLDGNSINFKGIRYNPKDKTWDVYSDKWDYIGNSPSYEEAEKIAKNAGNKPLKSINENATYSKNIDYKQQLKDLTKYMLNQKMNIIPLPKVIFKHSNQDNAENFFGKTAYYDPNTKTIVLFTEGRHPKDIVRSFAHEMIHHVQNLEGRLEDITTTNTQEDDHLTSIEAEAYQDGNLAFRGYTDTILNETKKSKDPFGLNQYARELAQGLEEELGKTRIPEEEVVSSPKDKDMDYIIYSDMDGVITDFEGRFKKFSNGISPSEYKKENGVSKFWDLVDNQTGVKFWVGMPWMGDGKEYWDYISKYKPTLLSSPSINNESRLGKRLWVKNNLPGTPLKLAYSKNKKNYAQENAILIDDREDNINQWIASGGIGILHTSASDTIRQLKELGL